MGLRDRLRRLRKATERGMVAIPQRDGTTAYFTPDDLKDAYLNLVERLGGGESAPPEHPLLAAVRNTSDPEWQQSFFMCEDPDAHTRPVPDLSEPQG